MHLMSARLMSDGLAVDPVENSEFRTSGQVENSKKKKSRENGYQIKSRLDRG
jgi:hypothetical protein